MRISVIIPSWNAGDLLCHAVASLGNDESVGEIIVVDNASTDGSVDHLVAMGLPLLNVIRNPYNVGAAKARHMAMAVARNDYVAFLDADDLLSPNALGNALRHLVQADLDMCVLQMVSLFRDGSTAPFVPPLDAIISGSEAFRRTLAGWQIHPMGVMRRSVYDRATDAFKFHGHSDDELLTRHLFLSAERVGGVRDLYLYRANSKPMTAERALGQATTELSVLKLAIDMRDVVTESILYKRRNYCVGLLFTVWNRLLRERKNMSVMVPMLHQIATSRIGWRAADWRYLLAFAGMRATVPILRRRRQP